METFSDFGEAEVKSTSGNSKYFKPNDIENECKIRVLIGEGTISMNQIPRGQYFFDKENNKGHYKAQAEGAFSEEYLERYNCERYKKKDGSDGDYKVSNFICVPIYDFSDQTCKIWNATQKTLRDKITSYMKNEDWGRNLDEYNITINHDKDAAFNNKYQTIPSNPKRDFDDATWDEINNFIASLDLSQIYRTGSPFREEK